MPGNLPRPFYMPHRGYPAYPYAAWPYPAPLPQWRPQDNGVLSAHSAVVPYDAKLYPRSTIPTNIYETVGMYPVLPHPAPSQIRVMSKTFPWIIEIKKNQAVTCKDFWKELYFQLQQPITASDWVHIARDESLKRTIKKAYKKRVRQEQRLTSPMRRIDYLGEFTLFVGLKKDDDYVQNTLMPGEKTVQETWVAKFARPA